MNTDLLERIERRLKAVGLSAQAASVAAGLSPDAIRNIRRTKGASLKTIQKLAPVLQTNVSWLMTGEGPEEGRDSPDSTVSQVHGQFVQVPIVGRAAAGMFLEIDELDQSEPEVMTLPPDPDYPRARQLAYIVGGDSMNDLKPRPILDGDKVIGLAYADVDTRMVMRDGMVVVVERRREGGHIREWSVKQVELYEDRVEFCPRSSNPRHKPIVIYRDPVADEGVTVEVVAIVRRVVNDIPLS